MPNFDFKKEYLFENDFVRLSPLETGHINELVGIANDPDIWTYFLENGRGIANLTKYVQSAIDNRKLGKEYPFVVFDKIKKQYAGMTRLYELNPDLKTIKLGHTWCGKSFQGTGLNKHCKCLLFEFVFEKLHAVRIGFGVSADNIRSINALKSVGCKEEGMLRDFLPQVNGAGRTDLILLSILKKEWEGNVKKELYLKLKKQAK